MYYVAILLPLPFSFLSQNNAKWRYKGKKSNAMYSYHTLQSSEAVRKSAHERGGGYKTAERHIS
jgi:hypothetical protein